MANQIIRDALREEDIKYWELADALKIHPGTLSARLRHDLPEAEIQRLLIMIKDIRNKKEREVLK
ncbi:MAG: hypothetical protein IJI33_00230 [Solobacterium sp.]|nr:hypothetical protein [Solobacterium sp.]MBQ6531410.1 hypothetical protein [Solobacterium sp.]MBR2595536.1 hypothetical protein [Solobacterium sp.]